MKSQEIYILEEVGDWGFAQLLIIISWSIVTTASISLGRTYYSKIKMDDLISQV